MKASMRYRYGLGLRKGAAILAAALALAACANMNRAGKGGLIGAGTGGVL
jgi:hypothetical protein